MRSELLFLTGVIMGSLLFIPETAENSLAEAVGTGIKKDPLVRRVF